VKKQPTVALPPDFVPGVIFDPFLMGVENEQQLIAMLAAECLVNRHYDRDKGAQTVSDSDSGGEGGPGRTHLVDDDSE